ncbi:MAG: sulfate adenylyltransferase subunit CysN [Planctomycetota bacterium]|nr:sulfate adenylyltransferase subunit CysN [Planctomycetota bacterium]
MLHGEELDRVGIDGWLEGYQRKELLRILTCGSVDDGKSTLIGRLLHDSAGVFEDQLKALKKDTTRFGTTGEEIDFALLMDGLQAEREQGITIDVAYRYFSTPRRKFIVADTPGHEQYTRNMATGASTSDLAIILIDARKGVLAQTRRHAFICSLLGIKHVVIAVNKMDLVEYSQDVFEAIRRECSEFLGRLSIPDVHFIPMSARRGENVVGRSETMPWYQGAPLLDYLETVHIAGDRNTIDLRLPVQLVLRPNLDFRGFAGTIASGLLRKGDEIVALPSGRRALVKQVFVSGAEREEAGPGMAVTITLDREIDISRGDLIARPNNAPMLEHAVEAMVVWMNEAALAPGRQYLIQQCALQAPVAVTDLRYKIDVNTLKSENAEQLGLNEIGRIRMECAKPIGADPYVRNRQTGAFILIDRMTNATVGAGMILDRTPAEQSLDRERRSHDAGTNLSPHAGSVTPEQRAARVGQRPFTLWLTGLPRSGKSSLAHALERTLFERGLQSVVLDGESLRKGLSSDLGFSVRDRAEHVRRASELARLLNDHGQVVIAAFVSPTAEQRESARAVVGPERFLELHCNASLEACEKRDTTGFYARARSGEIANVTGVDTAYEPPTSPALALDTVGASIDANVARILALLESRLLIG